jgi:ABC-2 type transport system permease protein
MRNIWLVARHEFLTNIRKKAFLFAVFGVPALMGGILGIVWWVTTSASEQGIGSGTIGFVDGAGILLEESVSELDSRIYTDLDVAQAALDDGEIVAYVVIPPLYMVTGNLALYANGKTTDDLQEQIEVFIAENIIHGLNSDAPVERLLEPVNYSIYMENSQRELSETGLIGLFIVPLLFVVILMMALQLSSQYLMSSVVEEKSSFIMEILITSVTPYQLLTGKLIGLGLLGLVQIVIWLLLGMTLTAFGGNLEFMSGIQIPADFVLIVLIYFVLTYFLYASMLAGIGALIGSEHESQQYAGLLSMGLAIPLFFLTVLLTDPQSMLFSVLMLIPISSAVTYMLRYPFAPASAELVGLSLLILTVTTIVMTWLSAKVFRWGLLLYGKRVSLRTLWQVVRGQPDMGTVPMHAEERRS